MDYADYVRNISFKYLQPDTRRPAGFRGANQLLRKVGVHLEMYLTELPEGQTEMRRKLQEVCKVPRMSTFAIGALINQGVAQLPAGQAYLNIGVWNGFTFLSGMAHNPDKLCIGVDNFSHNNSPKQAFLKRFDQFRDGPNHIFREGDFREYFRKVHQETLGFYLFDGPHTYADQLDGLTLAEPFFAEGCCVLVDDTNWDQVRQANLDFIARSPYEYRMLLDVKTPRTGHPTFWNGAMLFQKQGLKRQRAAA